MTAGAQQNGAKCLREWCDANDLARRTFVAAWRGAGQLASQLAQQTG